MRVVRSIVGCFSVSLAFAALGCSSDSTTMGAAAPEHCEPGVNCMCATGQQGTLTCTPGDKTLPGVCMCSAGAGAPAQAGSMSASAGTTAAPIAGRAGGSAAPSTAGKPAAGSGGVVGMAGTPAAGGGGMSGATAGDSGATAGMAASGGAAGEAGSSAPAGVIQRGPAELSYVVKRGPYMVESYTSGYRNGPDFADATVYYPTGDAQAPFAIVAVVPGYQSPQSIIQGWGTYLASHGIAAITIGTNGRGDQPDARADALMDALETLKGENTRMGSPIMGKLDVTRMGVMGHSMGGGGTLIAAQANPSLKAAVPLNPWEAGGNFSRMMVPTLIFTATGDTTAAPNSHAYPFYMQIPAATKKMLWSQQGSSHGSAINPSGASGQIGGYGVAWMKAFLEGDDRYIQILKTMPTGTARFENNL